jgi:cytochrome P450
VDAGLDLTDLDRFASGFPHDVFTKLRHSAPVSFHPTPHSGGNKGFWMITRHADCVALAAEIATFAPRTALDLGGETRHQLFRHLLMPALSPSAMRGIEDELHWHTERIVRQAMKHRRCDFVEEIADTVALHMVARVLGVPTADQQQWFAWLEAAFGSDDLGEARQDSDELVAYGRRLIEAKRRHPQADLLSKLLHAHLNDSSMVTGERMDATEVLAFFQMLGAGGAETARNAMTQGALAFAQHPTEWEALRANRSLLRRATDEVLRWSSPTSFDRRYTTKKVLLAGQRAAAGDEVRLWWASANRDEAVFEDPFRFDIRRDPNPHLAFGHGTHGCLGGTLARMTIRLLFDVLAVHCARIEVVGDADWVRSDRRTGLRHLPVALHAR